MVSAVDRHKRVLVSLILALGRTVPVATVLTKTEKAGNVLGAATAAMADLVVCAGCRRRRE